MSEDTFHPGAPLVGAPAYNASRPSDITSAQELNKYRQECAEADLTLVLSSVAGRAVLWRLLGFLHLHGVSDSLDPSSLAAMHGMHRAGNAMKSVIEGVDPSAYHRMALEAIEKERNLEFAFKAKREAAAKATSAQPPA